jgi:hypothetical protein
MFSSDGSRNRNMISDARRQFSSSAAMRAEGFENHQVKRPGQNFVFLLFHIPPVVEQQESKPIPVVSQHRKVENY